MTLKNTLIKNIIKDKNSVKIGTLKLVGVTWNLILVKVNMASFDLRLEKTVQGKKVIVPDLLLGHRALSPDERLGRELKEKFYELTPYKYWLRKKDTELKIL